MSEAVSMDDFVAFCNDHIDYAAATGMARIIQVSTDTQSELYESPGGACMKRLSGRLAYVTLHQDLNNGDTRVLEVDFSVEPPQVNELVKTEAGTTSRTIKRAKVGPYLAEISKSISLLPFEPVQDAQVLAEAARVVGSLSSANQ